MSEIIGCYSRSIARARLRDSRKIALAGAVRGAPACRAPPERGPEARVYKVDFNRGLVTIMRPVMEAGAHYLAKLELIIMFHGALR